MCCQICEANCDDSIYYKCTIAFWEVGSMRVPSFLVCTLIHKDILVGHSLVSCLHAIILTNLNNLSLKWNLDKFKLQSCNNLRQSCCAFCTTGMFMYLLLPICFVSFTSLLYESHHSITLLVSYKYDDTSLEKCIYKEHQYFSRWMSKILPKRLLGHVFGTLLQHLYTSVIVIYSLLKKMLVVLP